MGKIEPIKKTGYDQSHQEDDIFLMNQIALGNSDAFQKILENHMLPIYHFAFSILQDSSSAEDITQETCVKLWKQAGKWKPEGKLRSWLFRIAHNLCIDEIRRRRPHADIDTFADSISDNSTTAPQRIEESESSKTIKQALFKLPVRQRTALMLVHYSDNSNREAAETMGISLDALESLLARGRKSLKELLTDHKETLWEG